MDDGGTDLLKAHLRTALAGQGAHISISQALEGFPVERAGERPPGIPHSAWDLVYHVHCVLQDLIDWVVADDYQGHEYPSGYWPAEHAPASREAWYEKLRAVDQAVATLQGWVDASSAGELLEPLARDSRHSRLRQILLAIDHNSYHIGQLVDLRMLLGVPVKDW